jgi:signal recognition particle subunit SRP54
MRTATFTLEDFLKQMRQLRKMGPLTNLLGMMPGMKGALKDADFDEKDVVRAEAIIQSMTPAERHDPSVINNSRRQRIARGCGRAVSDVNALVRQFDQVKVMMRAMAGGGGMPSLPHGMRPPGVGPGAGRGKPKQRPHRPKQHAKGKKRKRK